MARSNLIAVLLMCSLPLCLSVHADEDETQPIQAPDKAAAPAAPLTQEQIDAQLLERAEEQMSRGRFKAMFERVVLTEDQHVALRPVFRDAYALRWAHLDEHRDEIAEARAKMQAARDADDKDALAAARKDYFTIYNAVNIDADALMLAIRAELTADQNTALDQHLEAEKEKRRKPEVTADSTASPL